MTLTARTTMTAIPAQSQLQHSAIHLARRITLKCARRQKRAADFTSSIAEMKRTEHSKKPLGAINPQRFFHLLRQSFKLYLESQPPQPPLPLPFLRLQAMIFTPFPLRICCAGLAVKIICLQPSVFAAPCPAPAVIAGYGLIAPEMAICARCHINPHPPLSFHSSASADADTIPLLQDPARRSSCGSAKRI